jgi:hypothetical protein
VTALAQALSRAVQSAGEFDTLKLLAIFCGIGLLVSLASLTWGLNLGQAGLDLTPGLF